MAGLRSSGFTRDSSVGWSIRIPIVIMLLVLGGFSAKQSLALVLASRNKSVESAYRMASGDARILALRSEALATAAKTKRDWAVAADAARRSVLRDPLTPGAIVVLGLNAGMNGDGGRATRLFDYSAAITRHDLKTNLWGIEQAVARGDVAGALRHYDIALRTSRQAPDILFPVLGAAIADQNIRKGLTDTLSKPSSQVWGVPFVRAVAVAGPDYVAAADLFARLRRRGFHLPEGTEASLLGALVTSGKYDAAWNYAAFISPGLSRGRSRDPHFLQPDRAPSPFDWNPINGTGLSSTIQSGAAGGAFTFSATSGTGGVVLRQFQLLPPGRYRIVSRLTELKPQTSLPFWTVQCVSGAEAARIDVVARSPQQLSSGQFDIPTGCPSQWLSLSVPPTDEIGGLSGVVDYASVVPVGR